MTSANALIQSGEQTASFSDGDLAPKTISILRNTGPNAELGDVITATLVEDPAYLIGPRDSRTYVIHIDSAPSFQINYLSQDRVHYSFNISMVRVGNVRTAATITARVRSEAGYLRDETRTIHFPEGGEGQQQVLTVQRVDVNRIGDGDFLLLNIVRNPAYQFPSYTRAYSVRDTKPAFGIELNEVNGELAVTLNRIGSNGNLAYVTVTLDHGNLLASDTLTITADEDSVTTTVMRADLNRIGPEVAVTATIDESGDWLTRASDRSASLVMLDTKPAFEIEGVAATPTEVSFTVRRSGSNTGPPMCA